MRACSHQCFKRSPCPVPAAVWVLLGKLAMACKLGILFPPNPLSSFTHFLLFKPTLGDWLGPHFQVPVPCDLSQGHVPWYEMGPLYLLRLVS